MDDSILCVVTTASTPGLPPFTTLTDARQESRMFFRGHIHRKKPLRRGLRHVAKLELSGPNEAKLRLYASVSSLDLWIHYIAPVIAAHQSGETLWIGVESPAPRARYERRGDLRSTGLNLFFFFYPFFATSFNLEPHSATYIQFTVLIRFAARMIMAQRCAALAQYCNYCLI